MYSFINVKINIYLLGGGCSGQLGGGRYKKYRQYWRLGHDSTFELKNCIE